MLSNISPSSSKAKSSVRNSSATKLLQDNILVQSALTEKNTTYKGKGTFFPHQQAARIIEGLQLISINSISFESIKEYDLSIHNCNFSRALLK